jgi:hypothetical protein
LEAAIAASGERAAADAATIAALQACLASERARAEAAEDRTADLRERVDAAQAEAERARAAAQAAQDRAESAERVDTARQVHGLMTRLARAEAAEARADAAEGRAHRAEHGRDAERALGDVLRNRIEGLKAQVATAEADAETARASAQEGAQTADALRKAEAELQGRLVTFFEPQEADAEQNAVTVAELRKQTGRLQIFVDAAEKDAAGKAAQAAFLGRVGFWAYVPLFVLLVLVFGGGMILASLDLLPPPWCGTTVNWWSWCLSR